MLRLANVIELLADARTDLLVDLGGVDHRLHAPMQREQQIELLEIGLYRRLHVGILQFAGEQRAVMRPRLVHLTERGGGGRLVLEFGEFRLPIGTKLRAHSPFDEGPAHRRRFALQLGELGDIFLRQRVRDGGQKLRHLHDRAFQPAKCRRKLGGILRRDRDRARKSGRRRCVPPRPRRRFRRAHSAARGRKSGLPRNPSCRSDLSAHSRKRQSLAGKVPA